jgi:hypothetical protein
VNESLKKIIAEYEDAKKSSDAQAALGGTDAYIYAWHASLCEANINAAKLCLSKLEK